MRKASLFVIILIKIVSAQNTDGEQFLYDCLVDKFNAQNINLSEQLSIIESFLVLDKIIESTHSLEYYKLLQSTIKTSTLPNVSSFGNKIDDHLLNYYFVNSNECLLKLKSFSQTHFINSRIFYLSIKLDSLAMTSNFNSKSIASLLISTLTPKDLNTPYFKAILLLSMVTSTLTSNMKDEFWEDCINNINVIVRQNGEIIINDSLMNGALFHSKIKELIHVNESSYAVNLFFHKTVSKILYTDILDEIKNAINSLRNDKSIELFSKQYSELDINQLDTINKIIPIRIKIINN